MKAVLDKSVAAIGIILLTPLFICIGVALRFETTGPIIFRQARSGFNGKIFNIYKFRTMTVQDNGAVVKQATADDPRVTRVGRWLRRTSLDELPQLVNVLKGDMSLVGPRPHALAHDVYYSQLIQAYPRRHLVKPGVTGWAQVNGYRGETSELQRMIARVDYDIWYIDNWSFWLDVLILWRTLVQQLRGCDHAY